MNENKIIDLIEELNRYAYEYYVLNNISISDKEYDKKYDELVRLEKETGIILPYSPTQRVGDMVLPQFNKYVHKASLWSLDKAQSIQTLKEWHKRNIKIVESYNQTASIPLPKLTYVLTKKFDGLTINCTYNEDGVLIKVATRGTGIIGEDVTAQAKTIKSLPLKIPYDNIIEIHGEAVMTRKAFNKYNESAKVPLKNLRNGAAGALRNLNVKETERRNLSAFFYDIGYNEGRPFETYVDMLNFIRDMGFYLDSYMKVCSTVEEIEEEIKYIDNIRLDLEYDIDGVVIAINDIRTRELLGYTVKFPKWAIAFKFEAQEATTKLLSVEWNIGRSGRVSPTALLEPVELAGATVRRATLNNMDDINRKKVRIGANVLVRRSNDVIPEIMGVTLENTKDTLEIVPPTNCPWCNSKLILVGAHYFCENSLSCKPQMVKSLVHYASREAMNIQGFSEKTAEQLFEKLNVKSIPDLYRVKKEELLTLEGFANKKAQNLLNAIESSKDCELSAFIYALSIPNVGIKTAKDLVGNLKTLENIRNASFEELTAIEDVGDIVAQNILKFFSDEKINESIQELFMLGISPKYEEKDIKANIFEGKTIVVTGSLENYTRLSIKEKLESLGATVSGSVSKKIDYVIVGEEAGSKYDKAKELNLKILTEEDFESMLK
ncbi:NAD-dependent DNA ligase LigA [Clostridium algidicarnis]|uniref:NAD-dependent DNA ligase LigA n=1 Tax=Clostridium algidicarnis TaxID=37659 RepID=UPI001C0B208A|nr:NAD-dependent DNA ligase LigA [Clostridium algidicarnis]MBU3228933.1 NAD-dependent DNA ligase LigA [Clostridium algidicarnis]MBU3252477.1 NAD-dependent DNA ligase LigA [Clostridium algidicarnis]